MFTNTNVQIYKFKYTNTILLHCCVWLFHQISWKILQIFCDDDSRPWKKVIKFWIVPFSWNMKSKMCSKTKRRMCSATEIEGSFQSCVFFVTSSGEVRAVCRLKPWLGFLNPSLKQNLQCLGWCDILAISFVFA